MFTRRGLLSVIEYLASNVGSDSSLRTMRRALARYYLGRVQPGGDQRVVARLLDAAGIGPGTWAPHRVDALSASAYAGSDDDDDEDEDGEWFDADADADDGDVDDGEAGDDEGDFDTDDLSTLIGEE